MICGIVNRRVVERKVLILDVLIFVGNHISTGLVNDLSAKGMFISTAMCYPVHTMLDIIIFIKGKCIRLPAKVSRAIIKDNINDHYENKGIGVEFLNAPSEYIDFINKRTI